MYHMAAGKCKVKIRAIKLRIYVLTKCFFTVGQLCIFLASSLRSSAKYDFFALVASLLVQPGLSKHCDDFFLLEI